VKSGETFIIEVAGCLDLGLDNEAVLEGGKEWTYAYEEFFRVDELVF
jgi:hypothetical protein